MQNINPRIQLAAVLGLALLMAATRGHHFATLAHLPSASWAVFFLAGVYLRPGWAFPALLAEAALLDYIAITWGGVSSFCVTPAYAFLLPAYGSLWGAGRLYARLHRPAWPTLISLGGLLLAGAAACELFSSGGFYFFSGRFMEPTLGGFLPRLAKYFPAALGNLLFYTACAAAIHWLFSLVRGAAAARASAGGAR